MIVSKWSDFNDNESSQNYSKIGNNHFEFGDS